jgi:putative ABC transport system permease protein
MLRTSVRNLVAHKLRLSLSGLAVILGVAFVAGTMIFTDTLEKTFTTIFEGTAADVNVEPKAAFETGLTGTGLNATVQTVPAAVVDEIRDIDGVEAVAGYVQAEGVYVLDKHGEVLSSGGAPGLGVDWSVDEALAYATVTEGRPPASSDEVALDTNTVEQLGYAVGDTVTLLTPGPRVTAELVGVVKYGESGGLAGASMTVFDTATAQELLLEPGTFTGVSVGAEDGVSNAALRDRVAETIGGSYDVKTQAEQVDDLAAGLEEGLGFITTFLLVFAGVALFVGSFLILNTFSMLVAQRSRELALLRALGASRRQVTLSVLLEALVLGVAGATAGLAVGYGLAHGLKALFGQLGLTLDAPLVLSAETVVWSYVVGVVVTLLAAYLPARRAAAVPPIAAMRAEVGGTVRSLRRRTAVGAPVALLGAAALVLGMASDSDTALPAVGLGAVALVVGVIALSPVLAVPFLRVVGALAPRLAGTTGHLARENALRNPRRTAATSSALMLGLALVTGFSIVGASANASVDKLVDATITADYVVSAGTLQPFTAELADRVAEVDGVTAVTAQRFGSARVDGEDVFFSAFDANLGESLEVPMLAGSLEGLAGDGILVNENVAEDAGLLVGDAVEFQLPNGAERTLTVGGVFTGNDALDPYLVSMETFNSTGGIDQDRYVYVSVDASAHAATVRAAIEEVTGAYPVVQLKDMDEFKAEQRGQVDQLLTIINALLVLSVLIAVLGVVNTLVLSVIERTRELGLLRAVGMTRRQLRRMVRLESVLISTYGAVLGLGLGAVLGLALTTVLEEQGISELVLPGARLAGFLVLGVVIGVLAAVFPARRAGRLKVLEAIATE